MYGTGKAKLVCCNRKHRREVLRNVHYFRTLIESTESCLEYKNIEFLRFLNKYYLLQLKYFFKVRLTCEIDLSNVCKYNENMRKKCWFKNVAFIR